MLSISCSVRSKLTAAIASSTLSFLLIPRMGAVMNGLLKLQATATIAMLTPRFLAISSTFSLISLSFSDNSLPRNTPCLVLPLNVLVI